jgi:hypothetical protein
MSKTSRLTEFEVFFGGEIDRLVSLLRNPDLAPKPSKKLNRQSLLLPIMP